MLPGFESDGAKPIEVCTRMSMFAAPTTATRRGAGARAPGFKPEMTDIFFVR